MQVSFFFKKKSSPYQWEYDYTRAKYVLSKTLVKKKCKAILSSRRYNKLMINFWWTLWNRYCSKVSIALKLICAQISNVAHRPLALVAVRKVTFSKD